VNPARSLGVTGVLLVLAACGGATPSGVSTPTADPTATAQVTDEPTASVDPNFNPGGTPTAVETTEPAKKKKQKEASPSPDTETSADKWKGTEFETAYETEFAICKSFGVKAVAEEYGVPANQIDAAQAVSEGYQPAFQQAAFEGCFDGFNAR
jgi:hypothetical protein